MNRVLIWILTLLSLPTNANTDSAWKSIIVEPDLLVHFPDSPRINNKAPIKSYEYQTPEVILKITSEKNPIDYKGRSVEEVDDEYYSSLTKNTITNKQRLISERNFKFDGQNVREIIYADTINSKPCIVNLQILNVVGFADAMYKFYFIDFKNRSTLPKEYTPFYSNWDLYYNLENEIRKNEETGDEVLKDKGFIIENDKSDKLKIILIIFGTLIVLIVLLLFYKKRKNASS